MCSLQLRPQASAQGSFCLLMRLTTFITIVDDHLGWEISRVSRSRLKKGPTLQRRLAVDILCLHCLRVLGTRDAIVYRDSLQQLSENGLRPANESTRSSEHPAPKVRRRLDSNPAS